MAESTEIVTKAEDAKAHIDIFSLFAKFKFDLPFLKPDPSKADATGKDVEVKKTAIVADEGPKPDFVRFPKREVVVPPPMETEIEQQSTKTSNPIILWQVYALGGVLVLRWIWARWNERKARGQAPDDESSRRSSSDDSHPRSSSDDSRPSEAE